MRYLWESGSSAGIHSNLSNEPENELQDLRPRTSTETQRRNGYHQSRLPDQGDRIAEDLQNGNYNCSICIEPITEGNTREYTIWNCQNCHSVFHYRCVDDWVRGSLTPFLGTQWKCPHCSNESFSRPKRTCWCGKETRNRSVRQPNRPHACCNTCGRRQTCPHGVVKSCAKLCHPGPCPLQCDVGCRNFSVSGASKPPGRRARFCERLMKESKDVNRIMVCMAAVAAIYFLLSGFIYWHVRWNAMPYRYPDFDPTDWETVVLNSGGIPLWTAMFFFMFYMFTQIIGVSSKVFNLYSTSSTVSLKSRTTIRRAGGFVLAVIFLSIWLIPILCFAVGPQFAWYHQMKNSCNGFSTRVEMDDASMNTCASYTYRPLTKFKFQDLDDPHSKERNFYLGSHAKPLHVSLQPFQYYQRLSEDRILGPSYAVDIDLAHNAWRFLSLDGIDLENAFAADRTWRIFTGETPSPPPLFIPRNETILSNGTFTRFIKENKHITIHPLKITIADMYGLVHRCNQEPFVRVFDTQGLDAKQQNETVNKLWSPNPDSRVTMRTASFGHGLQRIDMCMRRFEFGESELVPFAVVAAYRWSLYDTEKREEGCYEHR